MKRFLACTLAAHLALPALAADSAKPDKEISATAARLLAESCLKSVRDSLHDPKDAELPALPWSGDTSKDFTFTRVVKKNKSEEMVVTFRFRAKNAFNALRLQEASCRYIPLPKGEFQPIGIKARPL